jgi:hypothetical protein
MVIIRFFIADFLILSPSVDFRVSCKIGNVTNDGVHFIMEGPGTTREAEATAAHNAKVDFGTEDRTGTLCAVNERVDRFRSADEGKVDIDPADRQSVSEPTSTHRKGVRIAKTYNPIKDAKKKGRLSKVPRRLIICCKPCKCIGTLFSWPEIIYCSHWSAELVNIS